MKIRDLIVEQTPSTTAPVAGAAVDPNASSDDKLQQLTQALSDMRDKVTTLQKNALSQAAATPATTTPAATPSTPLPGTTAQPNVARGTIAPGTQPAPATTQQPAPGQKPGLGQPNGQPMGQAPAAPPPPPKPALGVAQPPQQLQAKMRADLLKQMNK